MLVDGWEESKSDGESPVKPQLDDAAAAAAAEAAGAVETTE